MTTFDLVEVRKFAADLDARMDRCDNGEGDECSSLEAILKHYAELCCEYREGVRQWGRAIFAGRVALDPEVEKVWIREGRKLFDRASQVAVYGHRAEVPCYILGELNALRSALWGVQQLLFPWLTPKLSVSPSARLGLGSDPATREYAGEVLGSLPPLPADWQPDDRLQRKLLRMIAARSS